MEQTQPGTTKYAIYAKFEVDGIVEKPDVIGAIFGQTEGLFGPELELRELQKTGRIGRIEIQLSTKQDKTQGRIIIPTSLDRASVALIAAALESIERIGPCNAKVVLEKIEDLREIKRKRIIERSREILKKWDMELASDTEKLLKKLLEESREYEVIKYGSEELPAGPDVKSSDSLIIVEGRADVLALLRAGIRNVIAIEGVKIPESVIKLAKTKKEVIAFLDGDRGGDLILKELMQMVPITYVVRAPSNMEVEDLTSKEILELLDKAKKPLVESAESNIHMDRIKTVAEELRNSLEAVIFNSNMEVIARIPVSNLAEELKNMDGIKAVVFDGIVTQRIVDIASEKGVNLLVGCRISDIAKKPKDLKIMSFEDFEK
ncbi:DNA primase [Candidatus Bathyarchaeota archaeon]|nr:DNA primase [Candidatus Bathyarchaeota archaeon]MBS7618196.1 DNA primase [Candidatus Bathyarchaeota archaeon]